MGLSISTYSRGVEAEIIVVDSLEELRLNKYKVRQNMNAFNIIFVLLLSRFKFFLDWG